MVFYSTLRILDTSMISKYSGFKGGWTVISTDCSCRISRRLSLSSTRISLSNNRFCYVSSVWCSKYDIVLYVVKQKCTTWPPIKFGVLVIIINKKVYLHYDNKKGCIAKVWLLDADDRVLGYKAAVCWLQYSPLEMLFLNKFQCVFVYFHEVYTWCKLQNVYSVVALSQCYGCHFWFFRNLEW